MNESQFLPWLMSNLPWLVANWPSLVGSLLMFGIYLRLNRFLDRFYQAEVKLNRHQTALNMLLSKCKEVSKEEVQELLGEQKE